MWSRPISGTPLTAGAESVRGSGIADNGWHPVADGRRTAWADASTDKLTVSDNPADLSAPTTMSAKGEPAAMSGHRVLEVPDAHTSAATLVDLATGGTSAAGALMTIWGQTGAGLSASTGDIVVTHLVTGATSTITLADAGVPDGGGISDLALQGDLLAWEWESDTPTTAYGLGWRNLRTGAQGAATRPNDRVSLGAPSVFGHDIAVTSAGSALVYNADTGSTILTIPSADGATLGPMGLGLGRPRDPPAQGVAPAGPAPVPRHEGNPIAASSFHQSSPTPWTGEWVFTEPLTACSVKITDDANALVRTLPCAPAAAAAGEAVVSWDGKNGGGAAVGAGAYHWTVVAADADGAAVDVDGTLDHDHRRHRRDPQAPGIRPAGTHPATRHPHRHRWPPRPGGRRGTPSTSR